MLTVSVADLLAVDVRDAVRRIAQREGVDEAAAVNTMCRDYCALLERGGRGFLLGDRVSEIAAVPTVAEAPVVIDPPQANLPTRPDNICEAVLRVLEDERDAAPKHIEHSIAVRWGWKLRRGSVGARCAFLAKQGQIKRLTHGRYCRAA